jgi:large subunit ribosomal protein L24
MVKISKICFGKSKIKTGDNVLVISGKDRGKTGLIEKVLTKNAKVLIAGVAIAKHHLKPSRKNPHGGIIDMPAPISASNVMLVCPHCGKAVRIAHRVSDTMKERICRKCQGNLDTKTQVTTKVKTKAKPAKTEVAKENNA